MAGGPSTPELAIAVCEAGALGFLAAGYKRADAVRDEIRAVRAATPAPFGVNVFVPAASPADAGRDGVRDYVERLKPEAERQGAELGEPRFDDDDWSAKLELLCEQRPAVASFTFGCPDASVVNRLHGVGVVVWVTVTNVAEALAAREAGADGLVVQGTEAGGHRGGFLSDGSDEGGIGLLALLRTIAGATPLPLVADRRDRRRRRAGRSAVRRRERRPDRHRADARARGRDGRRPARPARRAPPDADDPGVHRARRPGGSSTGS